MDTLDSKIVKDTKSQKKKNSFGYAVGLTIYSFTSLIFLVITTRINGVDEAGIFTFGFSFACMMQVVALYTGRTYQVTEQDKNILQADYLIFKLFSCGLMIVLSLIFVLIRQYDTYKIFIIIYLVIYKALDAYSESIFAIFQKSNNLYQCGISMTLKSILCVCSFTVIDLLTNNLLISTMSLVIADVIVFVLYDVVMLRKYKIKMRKLSFKVFKLLLIGGFSVCAFTFLIQYLLTAQKYVIDFISTNEAQTIFGIIVMPATFMAMCSQLIINPFLYDMDKFLSSSKYSEFKKLINKICMYVLVVGVVTSVICYFAGIPILNLIYGLVLDSYLLHLMLIIFGSVAFALVSVMSNALISIRKNTSQLIVYVCVSVFTMIISYYMILEYSLLGATVSFLISMLILLCLYLCLYLFNIKKLHK